MNKYKFLLVVTTLIVSIALSITALALAPSGATITVRNSTSAPSDTAGMRVALAGNVTEMDLSGFSNTPSWQGYYGNVTGTIQLADSADNVMYNWSASNPGGEVYASENSSVIWTNIACFNFTAEGNLSKDDTGNAGGYSQYGLNLSQIEARYGIASSDVDGVDETFSESNTHVTFYTNNLEFNSTECPTAYLYDETGQATAGTFEEVILYDPDSKGIVFVALLENDETGFDNRQHDFQLIVLEDGHGTDTATTDYYFYVELE